MSRRRFLVPPGSLEPERELELPGPEASHARKVLRLAPGDPVWLLDGGGRVARARLTAVERRSVRARVERVETPEPPRPRLVLGLGLLKAPAMDFLCRALTELMVQEMRPFTCLRSLPRLEQARQRVQRWRRLALQALKQCGAPRPPRIEEPVTLERLLAVAPERARRIMLYEQEHHRPLARALAGEAPEQVWLLVGPEGGFAPPEARAARQAGFIPCTLPGALLRAETAALAAAAVVRFGQERPPAHPGISGREGP